MTSISTINELFIMNVAKIEPYVPEIVVEILAFASKLQSLAHLPFCSIELMYDHRMVKKNPSSDFEIFQ